LLRSACRLEYSIGREPIIIIMAVAANSLNNSLSESMKAQLSEAAQRQLDALRAAVDVRLAALEAVLADPSRGESLEGLVLDLARVATEEAEAAASRACIAIKLEAETEIAESRTSAEAALEQEREVISQLRRELEQAQQSISDPDGDQTQEEFRAVRQQLEVEIGVERAAAADLERTVADLQRQIEKERSSGAELREAAKRAEDKSTTLAREMATARAAHQEITTQLIRERETAANLQQVHAQAQAQFEAERASIADLQRTAKDAVAKLEAERASAADLRRTAKEAQSQLEAERASMADVQRSATDSLAKLEAERTSSAEVRRAAKEAQSQLEAERASSADLRRMVTEAQSQLEAARASGADLSRAAKVAEDRLATLGRAASAGEAEHNEAAGALSSAQAEGAELRRALAEAKKALAVERALSGDLRLAAEQADQRAASVLSERVQGVANQEQTSGQLAAARAELNALRAEVEAIRSRAATDPRPHAEGAEAHGKGHKVEARPHPKKDAKHAPASPDDTEWGAVRLATRHAFRQKVDVQVNGESGTLCDLSTTGCQLLSPGALKPNQVLKVVLSGEQTSIACSGKVVWARIEPPTAGRPLFYRAGVQFTKVDQAAIDAFVAFHGVTG
jgi:chromosome segregation ATPase